ncbi:MAG TPA: EamA family transporter [Candidatus Limnocylindrales bacterium]|nr:EamA family transporter [Candidatus Limnocylindrales bacterium]
MPISFGFLAGLGAALSWGTMDVASALASRRLGSLKVTAGMQVVSAVLLVALAFGRGVAPPADPVALVAAALLGIIGAGAYLAYFTGLRIGPISLVSGVVAAYGGLVVVLAVVIRGETLTLIQAAGAAVATVGVILTAVAFDGGIRTTRLAGPGVVFAVIALVLFAVMTVGLAEAIERSGWLEVLVVSRVVNAVVSVGAVVVLSALAIPRLAAIMQVDTDGQGPRSWAIVALAGVLDVTGLIVFAIGLEQAETWLVGLVSSFGPAVTILIAVLFLGERLRPVQWLGVAGVGLGMVLIALP